RGCGGSSLLFGLRASYRDILASRDALGFVGTTRDGDSDRNLNFRMERQRHFVLANRLDRRIEHDLRACDLCTVIFEQAGNIPRRNRPKQLASFARLTQNHIALAIEFPGKFACFTLHLEIASLKFGFHILEAFFVVGGRSQGLAAWQQKVAGKAILHTHDVTHLTELSDSLEQYHFHCCYSLI